MWNFHLQNTLLCLILNIAASDVSSLLIAFILTAWHFTRMLEDLT